VVRARPSHGRRIGAEAETEVGDLTDQNTLSYGELSAAISTMVVHMLAETTGRGPTKAKTTLGENGVFVVLQDTLTKGERSLANAGEQATVLDVRRRWQEIMRSQMSAKIEELTGRKVVGFMSDNHIDPDLAVEVFVLERVEEERT
jgi:uncharacterized protein YbcI